MIVLCLLFSPSDCNFIRGTFSLRNNLSLLQIRNYKHIFSGSNVAHGATGVVAVFKFLCEKQKTGQHWGCNPAQGLGWL